MRRLSLILAAASVGSVLTVGSLLGNGSGDPGVVRQVTQGEFVARLDFNPDGRATISPIVQRSHVVSTTQGMASARRGAGANR